MTSNAGSNLNTNSIGFGGESAANKNKILDALKETFRPEFLNRVDEIVVFNSLNNDELLQIVDLMLKDTSNALSNKNIVMQISNEAKMWLLQKGTDTKYGARPLRRAIQRYVEDELSDMILKSELKNGETVAIDIKDDKLSFNVK
jgi:ATP-dependent Clp protease ATP-binding subunit ClpE